MNSRRIVLATVLATTVAATLASLAGGALAQAYPNHTISMVVSFPPGGDTDALARLFAE